MLLHYIKSKMNFVHISVRCILVSSVNLILVKDDMLTIHILWSKFFGINILVLVSIDWFDVLNWNILSSMSFYICVWHKHGWLKTFFSKIKVQDKTKTNKNRSKPVRNDIWWITIKVVLLKFRFVMILSRLSFWSLVSKPIDIF